jgi:four helix bundle protein
MQADHAPHGHADTQRKSKLLQRPYGLAKAKRLAADVYRLCLSFPGDRHRGLAEQMLRAAVSIPSNIAEGDERGTNRDSLRFLQIARGSLAELETQLHIAKDIQLFSHADAESMEAKTNEVARPLGGTIKMRLAREKADAKP